MRWKSVVRTMSSSTVALGFAFTASLAAAESAVVGSVNPFTGQATLLTDRLKTEFPDGGSIRQLYAVARGGDISNGFVLVRAGRRASGGCHTEVIALHRTEAENLLFLTATPVLLFTCEEIDDRCRPDEGPVLCMPNAAHTACGCLPAFAAAPAPSPKCQKTFSFPWTLALSDVVHGTE